MHGAAQFIRSETSFSIQANGRAVAQRRVIILGNLMFKEIFDQPDAIRDTLRGRVDVSKGVLLEYEIGPLEIFRSMKRVVLVGCGTSRHSALVGKCLIEHFARLQVDVDYASEFRDRDYPLESDTLFVAVSDSGKAADTLEAMHQARINGALALLICEPNDAAQFARFADSTLLTRGGPESGIVSTKTFTTQLVSVRTLPREFAPRDDA
jgi:glutamine---fructose-6-phosphate transaminase (isomerizing)